MPTRSQRHLREFQGYDSNGSSPSNPVKPITDFAPLAMAAPAAGAVGRTVYTCTSVTGGEPPYVMAMTANPDGLAVEVYGNTLRSTADPVSPVTGLHQVVLRMSDGYGNTVLKMLNLTLT